jgi:hypothetical protein
MNYEFKGTKTEWVSSENKIIKGDIVVQDNDIIICRLSCADYNTDNEAKANAQLISCSPEMFEMLNKVLIYVDWSYENWTSDDGLIIKQQIEQLLKKATTI